jgi:hypothetical protein
MTRHVRCQASDPGAARRRLLLRCIVLGLALHQALVATESRGGRDAATCSTGTAKPVNTCTPPLGASLLRNLCFAAKRVRVLGLRCERTVCATLAGPSSDAGRWGSLGVGCPCSVTFILDKIVQAFHGNAWLCSFEQDLWPSSRVAPKFRSLW